jgi:hypothetical protein
MTSLRDHTAYVPQPEDLWRERAACRGSAGLFFPPFNERPGAAQAREAAARALCRSCPVLEPCRALARQRREYGLWGAESEEERALAGFPVPLPVGRVAKLVTLLRRTTPSPCPTAEARM